MESINLKDLSVVELKAIGFDKTNQRDRLNDELNMIRSELANRANNKKIPEKEGKGKKT